MSTYKEASGTSRGIFARRGAWEPFRWPHLNLRLAEVVKQLVTQRRIDLREKLRALDVELSSADAAWLNEPLPVGATAGERYNPVLLAVLDR
jgi:hypothetical protein